MTYETIILDVTDGLASLTINRPKALNAINSTVLTELDRALDEINNNEAIQVVILTGAGDKAFVAGADWYGHYYWKYSANGGVPDWHL